MKKLSLTLILAAVALLASCKGTKFTGANQKESAKAKDKSEFECAMDTEFVTLNFPEEIKNCINPKNGLGHIFHFGAAGGTFGACTDVSISSFTCDFPSLTAAIKTNLGIDSNTVKEAQKGGAKLVGCGEKNGGKTIVAQWFYPQNGDCSFSENTLIVTSCYKLYAGKAPPLPTTPEEKRAAVAACMKEAN